MGKTYLGNGTAKADYKGACTAITFGDAEAGKSTGAGMG